MLADEIMVVSDGRVLQSGRCRDVYQRPASAKIGRLLGIDNLFEGVAGVPGNGVPVGLAEDLPAGARLLWQVPPETLRVRSGPSPSGADGSIVDFGRGRVTDVVDLGRTVEVVVELASGIELRARTLEAPDLSVGSACRIETDAEAVSVWSEPA
jgi:ABC-type Fe3+/spermidine/putrescine transport system ATPase subunit